MKLFLNEIKEKVESLDTLEGKVLLLRFGFSDGTPKTLPQVAEILHLSGINEVVDYETRTDRKLIRMLKANNK